MTIAGTDGALPGTAPGAAKVTALAEYPAKGRATAGVRAHRFLKGEDTLLLAWAGHGPAKASSLAGVARSLPGEHGRRDGSGIPLSQAIDAIGPSMPGSRQTGEPGPVPGRTARRSRRGHACDLGARTLCPPWTLVGARLSPWHWLQGRCGAPRGSHCGPCSAPDGPAPPLRLLRKKYA